eukprot:TRINITY_DN50598_c0_g1_i1.p1 TRINITY_DN50598_c0_g1~~TRINITY_DN50598_c0_g1_i1.p1  ORF type:complete len:848 (+),score=244.46 TRINITY_DN50598_c0_g1_i1:59-2545(+)
MPWGALGPAKGGLILPADVLPADLGKSVRDVLSGVQVVAAQVNGLTERVDSALAAVREAEPEILRRLSALEEGDAKLQRRVGAAEAQLAACADGAGRGAADARLEALERKLELLMQRPSPQMRPQCGTAQGTMQHLDHQFQQSMRFPSSAARAGTPGPVSPLTSPLDAQPPDGHKLPPDQRSPESLRNQNMLDSEGPAGEETLNSKSEDHDEEEVGPETYMNSQQEKIAAWLPDGLFRQAMDIAYMTVAGFEAVRTTISMADSQLDRSPDPHLPPIFLACSVFFLINSLTLFRTAVLDGWELVGDEEHEQQEIKEYYIKKGWFKFDAITCLPWDGAAWLIEPQAFWYVSLFRLAHLVRVPTLFKRSSPLTSMHVAHKALWFLYAYFIGVHFLACVWLALLPDPEDESVVGDEFAALYNEAFYFVITTMTTVGYGDIFPTTSKTRIFVIFLMVVGVSLYAYFLGNVSAYLSTSDVYELQVEEKKKALSALMTHFAVPLHIQKEAFCIYPSIIEQSVTFAQFKDTVMDLPTFMQNRVFFYMKLHMIDSVPLFRNQSRECKMLLSRDMQRVMWEPKEYVVRQGELGTEMYVILRGVVEVLVKIPKENEPGKFTNLQVGLLKEGSWFGEISLLQEVCRTASVRTLSAAELLKLTKQSFDALVQLPACAGLKDTIQREADKRKKTTAASSGGAGGQGGTGAESGKDGDAEGRGSYTPGEDTLPGEGTPATTSIASRAVRALQARVRLKAGTFEDTPAECTLSPGSRTLPSAHWRTVGVRVLSGSTNGRSPPASIAEPPQMELDVARCVSTETGPSRVSTGASNPLVPNLPPEG